MNFDITQDAYTDFRNIVSEKSKPIIAWIGSGLSSEAGLPTWKELINKLIITLENKARNMDDTGKAYLLQQAKEISSESDYWLAFQRLKAHLGEATYQTKIRELLGPAVNVKAPKVYEYLWRLKIKGLINLNIDRIATRVRQEQPVYSAVTEFNGIDVKDYFSVFRSPSPFILNLHGIHSQVSSWIFTREELNKLKNSEPYKQFLRQCLINYTILFVGISAEDEAVGGHLSELISITNGLLPHYWLTDKRDLGTDSWAENNMIRIIRYNSDGNDHAAVHSFFDNLIGYIPKDISFPPITPENVPDANETDYTSTELLKLDSESIRRILNKKAQNILNKHDADTYSQYEKFFLDFEEAIYRGWFTTEKPPNNILLGYKLESYKEKGAFGRIYQARDEAGNLLAIKVLHEEESRKANFLQSFRRGVQSMRILAERGVKGIVIYKDAYEIPAFVVMEWIDGANLDNVIKSKSIDNWNKLLKISTEIAKIVEEAHHLPERVLHRDLRPPNIMIENYFTEPENYRVVLLDFDLSWHEGSSESSIVNTGNSSGYLAPEQIHRNPKASTRHSSVDSFGFGMTLFFIVSRRDPFPTQHQHSNWEQVIKEATLGIRKPSWLSIPNRFKRIIINSTKENQYERWDIGQIRGELERLSDVLINPNQVDSTELLAEEIAARSEYSENYRWDSDKLSAYFTFRENIKIIIVGNESKKQVELHFNFTSTMMDSTKPLINKMKKSFESIKNILNTNKWKPENLSQGGYTIKVNILLPLDYVRENINKVKVNFDKITSILLNTD